MKNQILEAFLYNHKLKFNEIEKILKTRSNKLTYHLKKLEKQGILKKGKDFYKLSETAETLIPYLTKKQSMLPVVLVAIQKDKKVFLHERKKRPFKNKLSLPGGRILLGESIPEAAERIMKKKFRISCKFKKINSISVEHVKKDSKIVHSFLLILTTATTNEDISYLSPDKNKPKIISSDFNLIKKDLNKEVKINKIKTYL